MSRKLFCEISPFTYAVSVKKEIIIRRLKNLFSDVKFAKKKQSGPLPALIYRHNSLIRRKLGDVDMKLQENKAVNLSLSVPKVNGIIIRPGETFSFWKLVGPCTKKRGYKEGLTISLGKPGRGIGGGMCQFTNLLHWMVLHSPLEVKELHRHDGVDLFPDFGRQVPFGCGTSILYNYLDYRFKNNTSNTFQIIVRTADTHLCGELRALEPLDMKYHITEEDRHFVRTGGEYYRRGRIYREITDKKSGLMFMRELIKENNAKVMYSGEYIEKSLMR